MITSPLLLKYQDIFHAFGSKAKEASPPGVIVSQQVHGVKILEVSGPCSVSPEGYDILMSETPGMTVGVKTADCLPVLLYEPKKKIVVAVHAGWKGTLQRAVEKAITRIIEKGGKSENIVVAMGPSMLSSCYEVGEDVAQPFQKEFPNFSEILKKKSADKWLLNVPLTNRLQMIGMGVRPENIDHIELCTHCRPDLFHSYRRDKEKAGRMVNFIQVSS